MLKKILSHDDLLKAANDRMRTRPGYVEGMRIVDAEMVGTILSMRGECFLNADGSATEITAPTLTFYNDFANEFASEFSLAV